MATEESKKAEQKAEKAAAADAKKTGQVDPDVAAAQINREIGPGGADGPAVTSAENQGDNLEDKDSGSAVSSGAKSNPGKPGKDYDVETDPVITSSVARDEVRKELAAFGESPTLAGLVENYKGDRNV